MTFQNMVLSSIHCITTTTITAADISAPFPRAFPSSVRGLSQEPHLNGSYTPLPLLLLLLLHQTSGFLLLLRLPHLVFSTYTATGAAADPHEQAESVYSRERRWREKSKEGSGQAARVCVCVAALARLLACLLASRRVRFPHSTHFYATKFLFLVLNLKCEVVWRVTRGFVCLSSIRVSVYQRLGGCLMLPKCVCRVG